MRTRFICWAALLWLLSCHSESADKRLAALFEEAWQFEIQEDPLLATTSGFRGFNHLLPSVKEADELRRRESRNLFLERLRQIDRDQLGNEDQINYDMFGRQLEDKIKTAEFRAYQIPILADDGFHVDFARLPTRMPFDTVSDYENYLSRLRAFPDYVAQHVRLMQDGLKRGFTLPRVVLEGFDVTIDSHVVEETTDSVFYAPFQEIAAAIPAHEQERLRKEGQTTIVEAVVPGYRTFSSFMRQTYIPGARSSIGASDLPGGREYYDFLIRHFTSLELAAEEIHRIGLGEVDRILGEMGQVMGQVGFEGDLAELLEFLRTDPRFYAETPEELLRTAAYIAKQMDAKLPLMFQTLPRLPYGVEAVPDHLAPKYTAGRYIRAPIGTRRPGYYWVNTYALESRPLYTLEALTFHESVPGHHLQNALQQELENLPSFRRFASISAFGEGWGLYAERLGLEAGFYRDPYSNFGRLTYEMWRACRLVVDTGIHAMGWTRLQAMDYLSAHTALSLHEVTTETDRYISWPGQALAYKIGELKIRQLRRHAEEVLAGKFDLREFHDAVLSHGAIPLSVLESQIQRYIQETASSIRP